MKKETTLRIHIPEPCQQEWNAMTPQNGGRYCSQCTKVVHDFSQMSDTELLQFFKTKPTELCGRFHRQQLDREIKPVNANRLLPTYLKKMAAAVFAALSFRSASAQVQKASAVPTTTRTAFTGKNPIPETVTISGRVTKRNDIPVPNAKVTIDSVAEVYTDVEGKFSIQLSGEKLTTHNLYFSYEGLESAVRNFHPLMGSTDYDVRLLGKEDYRYDNSHTMGAPIEPNWGIPTISFTKNQSALSATAKLLLDNSKAELISNPFIYIHLVAYYKTDNEKKLALHQIDLIQSYLSQKLGIDPDRLKKDLSEGKYVKTVEISGKYY